MIKRTLILAAIAAAAALGAPSRASAQNVVGLTVDGDKLIVIKEKRERLSVKKVVRLKLKGADKILAFDLRAADNQVYGVSKNAIVYKINWKTGTMERKFALKADLPGAISMDCDAAADACRLVGDKGFNAHFAFSDKKLVEDKKIRYAARKDDDDAEEAEAKETPQVVAIAYTNGFASAESTQLYDLDATSGGLFEQVPPESGKLVVAADLKPKFKKPAAFDILSFGPSDNVGYMVWNRRFYQIQIPSGAVRSKRINGLKDDLRDVTIILSVM